MARYSENDGSSAELAELPEPAPADDRPTEFYGASRQEVIEAAALAGVTGHMQLTFDGSQWRGEVTD